MGSNGLTSARHDVLDSYLASKYPESFDPEVHSALVYSGSKRLTDSVAATPVNVGQLILSPTRTYAPVAKTLLDELRPHIHGMVHCSGGAQTKVLHFIDNLHVIKNNLFPIPPLFKLIQAESSTSWQEMYKVFNMGHRLEVYLSKTYAQRVIKIAQSFGIEAQIIGHVEANEGKKVTVKSEFGEFVY
jgi:phosphoribosylformylglycinamidine cyclo-ligase